MTKAVSTGDGESRYITVSDIQCSNLPGRAARYSVSLAVGGTKRQTAVSKRAPNPTWSESFSCAVPRRSCMTLTLWRHSRICCKRAIGSVDVDIDHRLDGRVDQDVLLELTLRKPSKVGVTSSPIAGMLCKITEHSRKSIIDEVVAGAEDDAGRLREAPVVVQAVVGGASGATANIAEEDVVAWEPVFASIQAFAGLVKDLSKIHPYAHAAMTVLSVVPTTINNQIKTDEQLKKLVLTMKRAYEFADKASALEHIELHAEFFEKMARATLECGNFIKEYVDSGSFVARVIKGIISDAATKEQIENHMQALLSLMDQFKENSIIHTEILTGRILQTAESIQGAVDKLKISVVRTLETTELIATAVDQLTVKSYLDEMRYADGAGCVAEKRCLEGTRVRLLDSITARLHGIPNNGHGSERILLLTGVAGSGKSAIAHEIAHRFKSLHRLGASFCFSASHLAERPVDRLLSTISRNMAEMDEGWRAALFGVIRSDKELRMTRSPKEQFDNFIVKPAQKLRFIGPIVVVIDAIDEVAEKDRDSLVNCLTRLAEDKDLPSNIRFLITSRPEPRMVSELTQLANVDVQNILDETTEVEDDIRLFVEHELTSKFPEPKRVEVREHWAPLIVERAENLFQWAATACAFITQKSAGSTPEKRFQKLQEGGHSTLYTLYESILDEIVENTAKGDSSISTADMIAKVRRVLALILTAREPLPWTTWITFLQDDNTLQDFSEVVPFLGSLLRGASEGAPEPIQPLHTSFRDYITLPDGTYTIDIVVAETTLATLSFLVMERNLKFNICNLETSHIANKDVPDLSERIQQNISPALAYACRFWTSHLAATPHKQFPLGLLFSFLEERLFFWVEVASLLRIVGPASVGIKEAQKWSQTLDPTTDKQLPELAKMLGEVDQFLSMCIPAISVSTPHLYLSAPAYVPNTSFIHRCYSEIYTGGVRVINKEDVRWPECILRVVTESIILDIAVSPDGRILATAHDDKMVRLWNVVTGERVGEPLKGHTDQVKSVAFSPDSKTLASGSDDCTVRLWNAETGTHIGGALTGHVSSVTSVAFLQDSKTLLSGSNDGTVRRWNGLSGELVGEARTRHGYSVKSTAFSPHGKMLAMGLGNGSVHVSTIETGKLVYAPLEGHTGDVRVVAFSQDGQTLASGSFDNEIRLWDATTGQPKGDPLEGHENWVGCVVFSPDGRILASGSWDHSIRLWTVHTGKPVGDPLIGHSSVVSSLAFCPDNQSLVSVSWDNTIRVWKTEAMQAEDVLTTGHSDAVTAVAFSPSNEIAASGSRDGTVRLWDVRTGRPVGEPLRGHTNAVTSVAFSPDGRTIVSGSHDRTIRLWNTHTGQPIRNPLVGHSDWVSSVVFSPDSTIVASGSDDYTIRLWSALTGEQLGPPLTGHSSLVKSVAFSPNGRCLASGSADKKIMLWDKTTRERIGEPLYHEALRHGDWVYSVAFSPIEQIIASGGDDTTIRLWRVDTRELIGAPLLGHTGPVCSVAFSPRGKMLVSGSGDGTIRLWDIATCKPIGGPLRGHTGWVNSVAFSPDGATILSGSDDHTIRLWRLPVVDSTFSAYHSSSEVSPSLHSQVGSSVVVADTHCDDTVASVSMSVTSAVLNDESSSASATSPTSQDILNTDSSDPDNEGGYMLGPKRELLFWVPPDYRKGLCRTSTQWVAGARSLRLDLSRFAHGAGWDGCRGH
ncbi:WD40 repeat-like protein [Trametopsis cervina]|nr:WD40 repeat-like protein [Trametopsis cervina]